MKTPPVANGTVISCSRRNAVVLIPPHQQQKVRIASHVESIVVGDLVEVTASNERSILSAVSSRQNCLSRTLGHRTKEIAANLDHVLLVTAVEPLFNTAFVDRVLLTCAMQEIPVTILVNKVDLGIDDTAYLIGVYEALGYPIIPCSAASGAGLTKLVQFLSDDNNKAMALAGISGVGKSSLLNQLLPQVEIKVGAVSRKTGQGTQTTSMAQGYVYQREKDSDLLLIDLPGIQNFGVSNLEPRMVASGFVEFAAIAEHCEYADCLHTAEPNCAVQAAIEAELIAPSRYLSYLGILDEIEAVKPW